MQLPEQAIKEFKEIYKKQFTVDISDIEANELGVNLLNLFRLVYVQPIKNENENEGFYHRTK